MMTKKYQSLRAGTLIGVALFMNSLQAQAPGAATTSSTIKRFRGKINHIVLIYQENWSFDGLYGKFPGANNLSQAAHTGQVDKNGKIIETLPQPMNFNANPPSPDGNFPAN